MRLPSIALTVSGSLAASLFLVLGRAPGLPAPRSAAEGRLRVCADPNNMPFSSSREEGIENALARIVAHDLGDSVAWTWLPQRRGFVRNTLGAGSCDVMLEAPAGYERVLTTKPYYRSSYVFVSRRDAPIRVRSLDDPALSRLRIGVQIVGDDYANTPPAGALGRRGLSRNVFGYSLYGDYGEPSPPARIIDAVARREVDLAIAWGPMAGYFASREPVPLDVVPVSPESDGPARPFRFAIAMGVRKGDDALRSRLDRAIVRRRGEIDAVLRRFHVPLVEEAVTPAASGGQAGLARYGP